MRWNLLKKNKKPVHSSLPVSSAEDEYTKQILGEDYAGLYHAGTPVTTVPQLPQPKHDRWTRFILPIIAAAVSFGFMLLWFKYSTSIILGIIFLASGGLSYWLFWRAINRFSDDVILVKEKVEKKKQLNSLLISLGNVMFKDLPNPSGQPQRCRNDNKKYYVMMEQKDHPETTIPFVLPDQQYIDPELFAQRVIMLPRHRKLFTRKVKPATLFSMGALCVSLLIGGIILLATA
jgi:hypothetical protein